MIPLAILILYLLDKILFVFVGIPAIYYLLLFLITGIADKINDKKRTPHIPKF